MFQAPRPISHAPIHEAYFKPADPIRTTSTGSTTSTHSTPSPTTAPAGTTTAAPAPAHTVAVPLAVSSAHRPIPISGNARAAILRAPITDPTNTNSTPTGVASPLASPLVTTSASRVPPSPLSHASAGLGFSLSTPSPPPSIPVLALPFDVPASPMQSPSYRPRVDSIDENEAASGQLQGILWRNVARTRSNSVRHPQTPLVTSQGMASPSSRATMSPNAALAPSALSYGQQVPSTPPSQPLSRSIPISKRQTNPTPAQLSIFSQLQHAAPEGPNSREGSRRGSATGSLSQSALLGSNSPLVASFGTSFGTSLGSSYLSHTPPVRAGNPLDRDSCFSPAQQAEFLIKSSFDDVLPMVSSAVGYYSSTRQAANAMHQSPVVSRSALSHSLMLRPSTATNAATMSKFASPQLSGSHTALPVGMAALHLNPLHQTQGTFSVDEEAAWPKLSCTL